jgi:membrane-associated protease RseP (regulator of RpoE activity)
VGRERVNEMRGIPVINSIANPSIVGRGAVRNGAVQTGAIALLLGAVLASGGARGAETNVERQDDVTQPAVPAPPAPPARTVVPTPPAPAAPPKAAANEKRTAAERAELDARMQDAQERLSRAASEIAEIAAERASDAMDSFSWSGDWPRRAVLGVQLGQEGKDGVKVTDVSPFGPAELAGVRAGDVIVRVNDKDVKGQTSREVVRLLRDVKPEGSVKLRVMRDGKPMDFDIAPRPLVAQTHVFPNEPPPGPDGDAFRGFEKFEAFRFGLGSRSELDGLEVTTLTPQLARYFGTEKGVLVVRAPKDDLLKLQDGDVIVSIDGREPTSSSHITRILRSYQPGERFTLRVFRDRKAQDIVVTLPERQRSERRIYLPVTPSSPFVPL